MSDPIDEAIKTTEPAPERGRFSVTLRFDGDRVGSVVLPADMSPSEWVKTIAFLSGTIFADMMQAQAEAAAEATARTGLVIARPTLVRPS